MPDIFDQSDYKKARNMNKLWVIYCVLCRAGIPRRCLATILSALFEPDIFMCGIRIGRYIDKGTYSQIFEIRGHSDMIAKKCHDLTDFILESVIMFRYRHYSNLVHLYGVYADNAGISYLIMRREHINLYVALYHSEWSKIVRANLATILRDILTGLSIMHDNGMIHRDLHAGNIFVSMANNGNVSALIADFGLANMCSNPFLSQVFGVRGFNSPDKVANYKTDIYAIGCIAYYIFTGTLYDANNGIASVKSLTSPEFYTFLSSTLEPDQTKRWSTADALKCDFLRGFASQNPLY